MVALRVMAAPDASVPVRVTTTPAMPLSPGCRVPSLLVSSQTEPDSVLTRSPKLLAGEPLTGRLGMVMPLATLLLPGVLPALVLPSA